MHYNRCLPNFATVWQASNTNTIGNTTEHSIPKQFMHRGFIMTSNTLNSRLHYRYTKQPAFVARLDVNFHSRKLYYRIISMNSPVTTESRHSDTLKLCTLIIYNPYNIAVFQLKKPYTVALSMHMSVQIGSFISGTLHSTSR